MHIVNLILVLCRWIKCCDEVMFVHFVFYFWHAKFYLWCKVIYHPEINSNTTKCHGHKKGGRKGCFTWPLITTMQDNKLFCTKVNSNLFSLLKVVINQPIDQSINQSNKQIIDNSLHINQIFTNNETWCKRYNQDPSIVLPI